MLNSNFILLFESLNNKEKRTFALYLESLYKNRIIPIQVFNYIKKTLPGGNPKKLAKEYAFKIIFKDEPFNNKKLLNALSDLYILLKEFLLWQQLKTKSFDQDLLVLDIFKNKKLERFFYQHLTSMIKKHEETEKKDIWHFLKAVQLNHLHYYSSNTQKIVPAVTSIKEINAHLDQFFFAAKFKYCCEILSREKILQEDWHIDLISECVNFFEKKQPDNPVVSQFYYQALNLISKGLDTDYFSLKLLLIQKGDQLTDRDQYIITSYLVNHATTRINQGQHSFIEEAFELYKLSIEKKILAIDGFITAILFYNIIDLACHLEKLDWLAKFIDDWGLFLEEEIRESTILLGKARLQFELNNFGEVLELVNQVDFENVIYAVRARTLMLRSFYELRPDYETAIQDQCKSFDLYLKRNKVLNSQKIEGCLNFLKLMRMLLRKKPNKSKLQKELDNSTQIICRSWLIEKIAEI